MTNPLSPDLIAWGAVYKPAQPSPGQAYWRVIMADGPMDIGGNHNLFVDVWDESGIRVVGVPVLFYWNDGDQRKVTEPKKGEGYAVDLPLFAGGNAYGVRVDDGSPSDDIFGFGMGSFVPHHSFRVVFQRTVADATTPTEPPPAGMSKDEAIDEAIRLLQYTRGRA